MWKKDEKKIALKCERKTKKNFLKIKKKSGRARFSGTGEDDHQFFFYVA
jgi:hypothetical protein